MKKLPHNSYGHSAYSSSFTTDAGKILKEESMCFSPVYREQGRCRAWEDTEDLCLDEDLKQAFDYDYTSSWATVVASLDYCNSLLYSLCFYQAPHLRLILNTAAGGILLKVSHITSLFCSISFNNIQVHFFPWPTGPLYSSSHYLYELHLLLLCPLSAPTDSNTLGTFPPPGFCTCCSSSQRCPFSMLPVPISP